MKSINKYFSFLLLFGLVTFGLSAQDNKAKELLSKLSTKVDSYQTLYIAYSITTENKQKGVQKMEEGQVIARKNKFKLTTPKIDIYSDGTNQWMHLKEENEVNISKVDPNADDIFSNPIKFLTGQRKDFKYKYKGEVEADGRVLTEIDYYPKDLKAPYSIIRLRLNEKSMEPYSIQYFGKEGMNYLIRLKNYMPNVSPAPVDTDFVFDTTKYPDIEVIDLR